MRAYIDISKYWPKDYTVNRACEEMSQELEVEINRTTIMKAKKGTLSRCELITIVRIRNWLQEKNNNKDITIDDLIVIKSG